jgi:HK97 family phage prohead protease
MNIKESVFHVADISLSSREAVLAHATYKSLDKDGDRANRGMFDKSWKEKFHSLRYFFNHDRKQAPGKPIRGWDDQDHAYTQVKHGTHTLGEDVLKMLDEGTIVAISYGFEPIKQRKIQGKGYDYLEVMHGETSVLTHWGAHDESHVVTVQKSFELDRMQGLQDSITRMEKFIRNTTASDEAILLIQKELSKAKALVNKTDTAISTEPSLKKCPKCNTESMGISDEAGRIKCAECSHILVKDSQPDASSKSEQHKKLLLLKLKNEFING